jgi:hypothetical protein
MKRRLWAACALLALLFTAATPTYYGSVVVPSGGSLAITGLATSAPVCTDTSSPAANITTTGCAAGTVTGITAGSNIVVTGSAPSPTVAVTNAPTFTGVITASGALTLGNNSFPASGPYVQSNGGNDLLIGPKDLASSGIYLGYYNTTSSSWSGLHVGYSGAANNFVVTPAGAISAVTTIAASGTITDSNATPLTFSNTTANTVTSAATGAVSGLVFNDNGAALTGDLLDVQLGGATKAFIGNAGNGSFVGVAVGGALSTATTGAFSGTITDSSASPLTFSATGSNTVASAQSASSSLIFNATTTSTNTTSMFNFENNGTMEFEVGSGGNVQSNGAVTVGGGDVLFSNATSTPATTGVFAQNDNASHPGLIINVPSNTINGFRIQEGGTTALQFGALGTGPLLVAPSINSVQTLGQVPPCYTVSGTACGSTTHIALGTCAFSSSTSCTPTAFSANAEFASATSYACSASGGAGTFAQTGALSVGSQSTTGIVITAATSNSQTVTFICTGT